MKSSTGEAKGVVGVEGFDDQWGDDPFGAPKPTGSFGPEYFTLIVIRIRSDLKIDAAHASYNLPPGNTDSYVLSLLSGFNLDPAKPITLPPNPYPKSSGVDLINLGFGSERKVYFYVVNPTVKFVPNRGIRFTQFDSDGSNRDKNKSFYNARSIPTGTGAGPLLYVENYYRDEHGGSNGSKDRYYSMNLALNMATPSGGAITILIDPGTGNGGNWRP
jgi:hypothetical protein